jgi:hypothetical protein
VSRRALGTPLTWLSARDKAVFIVATANDISQLPPALIRKGRFDEIHLGKRKLDAGRSTCRRWWRRPMAPPTPRSNRR